MDSYGMILIQIDVDSVILIDVDPYIISRVYVGLGTFYFI
jgi:hypothetical protein